MDPILLYVDFILGNLDNENEKAFTRALTSNDKLRRDFREFLVATNTPSNVEYEEITFPDGLTESLYKKLGYKTDDELNIISVRNEYKARCKSSVLKKYLRYFSK
jgi:hypothetical protein